MTQFNEIHFTEKQMDAVLDSMFVLRPPIDRVRLGEEFTTCDVLMIFDRLESNPCSTLLRPGYVGHVWDNGRGNETMFTHETLASLMRQWRAEPAPTDQAEPVLAGWLVVAKQQIDVLEQAQENRDAGQPVNLVLLAELLDAAGKGARAITPPTPAQLARPRWGSR